MNDLENIKLVLAEFEKYPKGIQNCAEMAEYAAEVLPWLALEIEQLRAENAAYQDYISGKTNLAQLEAALNRVEPIYRQKPVEEWVTGKDSPIAYSSAEVSEK